MIRGFLALIIAALEIALLLWAFLPFTRAWLPDAMQFQPSAVEVLGLHAVLSLAFACIMSLCLPARYREPRRFTLGLLFLLGFFIPLAGAVGLWLVLVAIQKWPSITEEERFRALAPPEFAAQGDHVAVRFGAGGVRARLSDRHASAESRLEALLAIKAMPQRVSSNILRDLLDDPEEDLRLLAYGMLDSEEKNINQQINQALDEYRETTDEQNIVARKLAFLYWELIYHNLAQGDVRLYALQEATRYADETLTKEPEDAGIWVLLGKIRSASGEWDAAHAALLEAQKLGYPFARLIPYLAEHAFRKRQFGQVKNLLQSMETLTVGDLMQPVTRFWKKNENQHASH